MRKTFAQIMNDTQVMTAALKTNLETLKKRGMTQEFIDELESVLNSTIAKNNDQERLKAELKTATAAIDKLVVRINELTSEAVKVVKLDIPKEQWKEFAIQAKK